MEPIEKIKALQQKMGIASDGIASPKTWLHIYYLLFKSVPYDINVNPIIKAIQEKINVRADGYPWIKTWDVLYDLLIDGKEEVAQECTNEAILQSMATEVIPFAKELLKLAGNEGIIVKLIDDLPQLGAKKRLSMKASFGLSFKIEIYEMLPQGLSICKDNSPYYLKVAKLGESIGLTWRGNDKSFTSKAEFEIRPAWAVQMNENEMVQELNRRKKSNLNLLAIF